MPETLSELGTVTPVATVTVLPQLSGYLTEVGYQEGQDVKKGQFLAQIDPRQYEIDLQQAQAALLKDQAALAQARSDLARYHQLQRAEGDRRADVHRSGIHRSSRTRRRSNPTEANIAQYKLDLIYCHITAPVAGRVGLRLVDPGNYVTASSSPGIVVITTMKPTTVEFTVAQNDLGQGDRALQFRREAAGDRLHQRQQPGKSRPARSTPSAIRWRPAPARSPCARSSPNDDEALFPERVRQRQDPGRHACSRRCWCRPRRC